MKRDEPGPDDDDDRLERRPVRRRQGLLRLRTWLVDPERLSIFFLVIFWLASAYWVYKDARRRIEDPWLLAMAVALGIFPPFLGPLIYMLFRPPEYLEDVRERELEIKAIEESVGDGRPLPGLPRGRRAGFLACPVCTTKLQEACRRCKAPLEPRSGRSARTARRRSSSRRGSMDGPGMSGPYV